MLHQAIDEDLIERVRILVANDINRRIRSYPVDDEAAQLKKLGDDRQYHVLPEDIYILSFERVLGNWSITATASVESDVSSFYKIIHDGDAETTIVHLYIKHSSFAAVV